MKKLAIIKIFRHLGCRKKIAILILIMVVLLLVAAYFVQMRLAAKIREICYDCSFEAPVPTEPERLMFYKRLQKDMDDALAKIIPNKILQITALPSQQTSRAKIEQVFDIKLQADSESRDRYEFKNDDMELVLYEHAKWLRFELEMLTDPDLERQYPRRFALPFGNCMDVTELLPLLNQQGWNSPQPSVEHPISARLRGGGEPYIYRLHRLNYLLNLIYERDTNCVLSVVIEHK